MKWILTAILSMTIVISVSGCTDTAQSACQAGTSTACRQAAAHEAAPAPIVKAAFEGGEAQIEFTDEAVATEFIRRTPVSLQFQDQQGVRKVCQFPAEWFSGRQASGLTPSIGDIALNVRTGEVTVFSRDSAYAADLLLLGHVITGLDKLFNLHGTFEVYVMKAVA